MSDKEIAKAVGHIPSGLFIVATKSEKSADGYLASWVQQVSFEPLLVSIAINSDRAGYDKIVNGQTFTINVVGDHEMNYLKHFWSGYTEDTNPFSGELDWKESKNGGVQLSGAKSTIDCKFVSKSKPGDHEILIAEVINSEILNEESRPKTHIRKSGLDY